MSAPAVAAGIAIVGLLAAWAALRLASFLVRGDERAADGETKMLRGEGEGAGVHSHSTTRKEARLHVGS